MRHPWALVVVAQHYMAMPAGLSEVLQ